MTERNSKFFAFQTVTILTTDKCTAKCDHCCVSSSPYRKAKLSFQEIKEKVDLLIDSHPLKVVVFAGGEPSLLKDDLVKSIKYCTDKGLLTRVVTNASWAINEKKTDAMLSKWRDAGLVDLNISADDYHLPYIPLDRVKRIWKSSKNRGFNSVIIAVAYQKNSEVNYKSLTKLLEEPNIPMIYDEDGNPKDFSSTRQPDGTVYAILQRPTSRSGRGIKQILADEVVHLNKSGEYSTCPWVRVSPAVSPKGELISCCGFETRRIKALNYGPLESNRVDEIKLREDDVLLHALANIGPKRLLDFVTQKKGGVASFDSHVSMCEACEDLMSKPTNIRVLRENAAEIAAWSIGRVSRKAAKDRKSIETATQ